ncbi:MAG TPA: fumarate hydratase [Acidobacteriota bacterium]|jgi:fumarate hydratase subunit alpha/L(+)-tartrate dehydratase alpha subunit|nr:fumarate hydratase [Acidobacteriota bacterium]
METLYDTIEEVARNLYVKALRDIPQDVRAALRRSLRIEKESGNQTATQVLTTIDENIAVADTQRTLVCQDTGLPLYKVLIGTKLGLHIPEVKMRIRKACERATRDYPLRSNTVHPLTRQNTHTNTGEGIPIIKLDFAPDSDRIAMQMAPKGSGSENMSFLKMLNPAEGIKGIKRFVLECVFESGARPCPPVIVGIGLGGTSDVAMTLAKEASTFRKIGSSNSDPQAAALEKELLDKINQTGIGPQGLGGITTALAVHIEWAHTHITQNPVAVNLQCWRGERAEAVIERDGRVCYGS